MPSPKKTVPEEQKELQNRPLVLSLEERETHAWRDDVPGGAWQIETPSPRVWARLDRMFKAMEVMQDRGRTYSKVYRVPLSCVTFRRLPKLTEPRKMTDAQRQGLAKGRAIRTERVVGGGDAAPS